MLRNDPELENVFEEVVKDSDNAFTALRTIMISAFMSRDNLGDVFNFKRPDGESGSSFFEKYMGVICELAGKVLVNMISLVPCMHGYFILRRLSSPIALVSAVGAQILQRPLQARFVERRPPLRSPREGGYDCAVIGFRGVRGPDLLGLL